MTPETIALKLTDAQRRWLFKGPPDSRSGYWPVRNAMSRKGLIGRAGELSPLGIQVRDYLEKGRKWFPHLDFTGEPMREGQFREPYPMQEERDQGRHP